MGNPVDWVDPLGLAKTSKVENELISAKVLAQKKAAELLEGATSNTQRSKLPRAVSAAIDRESGQVFYGLSGRPHPADSSYTEKQDAFIQLGKMGYRKLCRIQGR